MSFSWRRLTGFLTIALGFAGYICWLAWPSLLPLTNGPDLVHHLSLIHFIQRRHALPHDPALGAYLGEMATYTPGSHLLAALASEWLRADALRIIHPLQAVVVALKAALIYNTFMRILPGGGSNVAPSLAGTLLLLLPHRYLLEPVTVFGFYSQVVAETFAVAILWIAVLWFQQPLRAHLAMAGVFCAAIVLCWPVYLPAPALALTMVVLLQSWRTRRRFGRVVADLAVALGPSAVPIAFFSAPHAASAGILRSGGSVLVPSADVFGWPFLLLASAGVVVAIARARTAAPVLAFTVACAAQVAALAMLQARLGATNLYLANKSVFLLVYPAAVFGGLALDFAARSAWRSVARNVSSVSAAFPLVIVAALLPFTGLSLRPIESPFREPVYRVGLWARANVPAPCVDYFAARWLTGYWLHLDVLGNARASERMRTETFEYRAAVARWILPGGLPFAIVEDLGAVPVDARRNMDVLHQFGPAAVVRRADGLGKCSDTTPPIDRVAGTLSR